MVSILTEYKLFDEDSCTVFEDGDIVTIETYDDTYKEVSIVGAYLDSIIIETDDYEEIEINVSDIVEIELC